MAKAIHLYYDIGSNRFFEPRGWGRGANFLALTRRDYILLRIQFCKTRDFTLASDLTAPTAAQSAITDFSTNFLFALKTHDDYASGDDFTLASSGLLTSDSAWHSTAAGRVTHATAVPSTVAAGVYLATLRLTDATGNLYTLGTSPTDCMVVGEVALGDEVSTPSGLGGANWYTGTITAGNTYVDITVTGASGTTKGVPVLLGTSGGFTTLSYTSPSANTIRVIGAAAAPTGGYAVAFLVISL